jgi:hypothetical protein
MGVYMKFRYCPLAAQMSIQHVDVGFAQSTDVVTTVLIIMLVWPLKERRFSSSCCNKGKFVRKAGREKGNGAQTCTSATRVEFSPEPYAAIFPRDDSVSPNFTEVPRCFALRRSLPFNLEFVNYD